MRRAQIWVRWSIACVLAGLVGACAGVPRDATLPINDPNEQTNRQILAANQAVLRPVARVIKAVTPGPVHDRLHDFNANLKEPRIFVNDVLQFRFDAALHTAARFAINSSFGIGGLVDIASREGLAQESGDFGQTLFVWGFSAGPYVVQPYMGPSTLRDAVGAGVDFVVNPIGWVFVGQLSLPASIATGTVDAVARLGELKTAEDASIDFYSFMRSSFYQMRRAQLRESIGLPNVVESPATSLDETENSAHSNNASVILPIPRPGARDNALRPNTKQTSRVDQEPTRELALTTR
jgi:phospholipid-binding lipoprotein MlaA